MVGPDRKLMICEAAGFDGLLLEQFSPHRTQTPASEHIQNIVSPIRYHQRGGKQFSIVSSLVRTMFEPLKSLNLLDQ